MRIRGWRAAAVPAVLVLLGGVGAAVAPGGCDVETTYHCAVVRPIPIAPAGERCCSTAPRTPTSTSTIRRYLAYDYAKAVVAAIDSAYPDGRPLRAYHIGGGGLTVPRYLERTRPGTPAWSRRSIPAWSGSTSSGWGCGPGPGIDVRVEDARLGLRRLDGRQPGSRGRRRLRRRERALAPHHPRGGARHPADPDRPEGLYAVNLLDYGPLAFARAEVATLAGVFDHVALATESDTLTGGPKAGGNLVVLASDAPLDVDSIAADLAERGADWRVITGAELDAWTGDAPVLTDDYAPVDQLLTPYPR